MIRSALRRDSTVETRARMLSRARRAGESAFAASADGTISGEKGCGALRPRNCWTANAVGGTKAGAEGLAAGRACKAAMICDAGRMVEARRLSGTPLLAAYSP